MTLTGGFPIRRSAASATANFSEHQTRGSVSAATEWLVHHAAKCRIDSPLRDPGIVV